MDDRLHDMEFGQIIEHRVIRNNKFVIADLDVTRVPGGWIFHQCYFSSDNEMRRISQSTCFVPDTCWIPPVELLSYVLEIIDSGNLREPTLINTKELTQTLCEPQRTENIRQYTARSITFEVTVEILTHLASHSISEQQIKKASQGFLFVPKVTVQ